MNYIIRFVQFDVPYDAVHQDDAGVTLPAEYEGWDPFQVEIRGVTGGLRSDPPMLRLAVWLRAKAPQDGS